MTKLLVVPVVLLVMPAQVKINVRSFPLFVIPAQAGIHLARNTLEASSDGVASTWIPGLRPG